MANEGQEQRPPVAVAVASACGRAIGAWFVLYLIWMHLLVVWEWSSGDPVTVATGMVALEVVENVGVVENVIEIEEVIEYVVIEAEEDENATAFIAEQEAEIVLVETDLESLDALLLKLRSEMKKVETATVEAFTQRTTLKIVLERVNEMVKKGMPDILDLIEKDDSSNKPPTLDRLVEFYTNIKELGVTKVPAKDFENWIDGAIDALDDQIEEKDTVLWQNVTAILRRKDLNYSVANRDVADAISKQECPMEDSDVSLVTEDLLEDELRNVVKMLRKRASLDPPIFLTPILEHIQEDIKLGVGEVVEIVSSEKRGKVKAASNASQDYSNCVLSRNVVPWVEVGLEALEREKDIRPALLRRLAMDSIDTSNIILDADFDDDESSSATNAAKLRQKLSRPQQTVSLRRLLATPIMTQLAPTIVDQGLELVSGYNDAFDQLLDSIIVAHQSSLAATGEDNFGTDRSSLGKEVVHRLLEFSGRFKVPVPAALRQTKLASLIPDL
jgi:hypothetical protein